MIDPVKRLKVLEARYEEAKASTKAQIKCVNCLGIFDRDRKTQNFCNKKCRFKFFNMRKTVARLELDK